MYFCSDKSRYRINYSSRSRVTCLITKQVATRLSLPSTVDISLYILLSTR